jgi:hypothetical protein
MLNLYRRHLQTCPHRAKGQSYTKCSCPIWADGQLDGGASLMTGVRASGCARRNDCDYGAGKPHFVGIDCAAVLSMSRDLLQTSTRRIVKK